MPTPKEKDSKIIGRGKTIRLVKAKEEDYILDQTKDNYRVVDEVIEQIVKALGFGNIQWDRFTDVNGANRVLGAVFFNSVANSAFEADWSESTFDNVNPPFVFFLRCVLLCELARLKNPQYNCLLWMQGTGEEFKSFVAKEDGKWRLVGAFMKGFKLFTRPTVHPFKRERRQPIELANNTYVFTLNGP